MRILVISLNYAPEFIGIAPYSTGMVEALTAAGHQVEVISGKPYYPQWRVLDGYRGFGYRRSVEGGARITRCPIYVPARPSGVRRIAHHASFVAAAAAPALTAARRLRPDIVLTVAPSLLCAPLARRVAQVAGGRSWLHVQDFEVEAAIATGLLSPSSPVARAAIGFQTGAIADFDAYSSISPQMCDKLIALGAPPKRVYEFRNFSDLDAIRPLAGPSPYRAEWGIAATKVALYSGNIARKQGIAIIIDVAERLRDRSDIAFVICGDGPYRAELAQAAAHLPSVHFRPLQPFERLTDLLGLATVHLLPQLAGAADLVLPSKLTNMLASGRPVVATADTGTGLANEVEGCGIVVPPGDAAAMAEAIRVLADDPARAAATGDAARRRAEERWSREAILAGFRRRLAEVAAAPLNR